MTISLHQARIGDVAAIMRVMDSAFDPAFGEAWTPAQLLTLFAVPSSRLCLARSGDGIRGFSAARVAGGESELLLLAVDPAASGQGVGRLLVADWRQWAAEQGASDLFLEMRADNPALGLYNSCGFSECGRRPAYYRGADGIVRDAITMRLYSNEPDNI